jgi:dissimilatory sulfite reductase (desulfoviridin) alpha/beta subunit
MTFRNVVSCLGEVYCFKAAAETTDLAREIGESFTGEKTTGPLKVGIGGCPFPCTRPQFNEIGIMGRVRPELDLEKCTGCGKCVEVCEVGAASIVDGKAVIDYDKCVMCGRCVVNCPVGARYTAEDGYMVFVGGRGAGRPTRGGCSGTSSQERRCCPSSAGSWRSIGPAPSPGCGCGSSSTPSALRSSGGASSPPGFEGSREERKFGKFRLRPSI